MKTSGKFSLKHNGYALSLLSIMLISSSGFVFAGDNMKEQEEAKWDVSNPVAETKEIALDVTSGTWMSVDVSSDGQTVVFDLLGDIYTLSINGGEATNIASGMAWDIQPRFSPDGSKIAFTSDRDGGENIWVMDKDGSNAKQISAEKFRLLNSPDWGPDGNYIIARKHFTTGRSLGTGEVWMYHIDGGKGVAVVERPSKTHQKDLGEPVYSPDGEYIYYSLDSTTGGQFIYAQDSNSKIYEIRRIELSTGETENIINGVGGSVRPTPSPDGKSVAFIRRIRTKSALYVKDLESGSEEMIYANMDQDNQETWAVQGTYPGIDWTPDGGSIVFWAGGKINKIDVASKTISDIAFHVNDIRTINLSPRPKVEVAPDTFKTKMVRWPIASPDGSKVVFESLGKLYIKNTISGDAKRLTRDNGDQFEMYPSFSADGRTVVFATWHDQELGSLRSVRSNGGRSKTLSKNPGHYLDPRYSPDGETLVFRKRDSGRLLSNLWSQEVGIYTMSADGGVETQVSEDGFAPHFANENDRVYYSQRVEGNLHLFSSDLSGFAKRDHANSKFSVGFEVSPDGQWIAWKESYQAFIAPFTHNSSSVALSKKGGAVPATKLSGDGGNYIAFSGNSDKVYWSLGSTLYSANLYGIFAEGDDEYKTPESGIDVSITVEADKPNSKIALTGARLITMNDKREVIENGIVLIEGNRIIAIGNAQDIAIPTGYKTQNMSGKTIIPGLIDAHAHGPQAAGGNIIPQQNWSSYAHLALGVTTIHDPSNTSANIFAASEYQRAGIIISPRIYGTGEIIYGAKAPSRWAPIDSYDDALTHVRRLKAQGAISVKNYNQPRRDQRQQVVQAARDENMLVVAEGGALYHMDMNLVADGNSSIEHTLPTQKIYDDVVQFWSQTNVAHSLTLVVNFGGIAGEDYFYQHFDVWKHPILSNFVPAHILQPRAIRRQSAPEEDYIFKNHAKIGLKFDEAGISINLGAHGQREGLGTHWEMWMYAKGGATPMQTLEAATINPATNLGLNDDIGSLVIGKLADLVVLDENPLENIFATDKISYVMVNGRLYNSLTLDEVATGNRKTKPFYWSGRAQSEAR
jgi:imidazolonepropionase-like amidohydrolase/Tol biopolymer transport system component